MAINNKSALDFSIDRAKAIREFKTIDSINSLPLPREMKAIMYGNIKYESDNSFDINKLERLKPGVNRGKGKGLFQKTGETRRNYEDYLDRNNLENNELSEVLYYSDAMLGRDKISGSYLGPSYMQDYRGFFEGKPSGIRGGRHGIPRKSYQPVFNDMHEHFVNFMMNPLPDAREKSMPTRLQYSRQALENIFTD
jgi:hypothetical protein